MPALCFIEANDGIWYNYNIKGSTHSKERAGVDREIIISYNDTLNMLDDILEKRDHEWWNRFYSDRDKPVPFFKDIPDEELVSYCDAGILTGGNALDVGCGNGRNALF